MIRVRTSRLLVMLAFIFLAATLTAAGDHRDNCTVTSANPETVYHIQLGGSLFYIEERNTMLPGDPPVPLSGAATGDGTWVYEEINGLEGLQRGGTSIFCHFAPPFDTFCIVDPVRDETCSHGADSLYHFI